MRVLLRACPADPGHGRVHHLPGRQHTKTQVRRQAGRSFQVHAVAVIGIILDSGRQKALQAALRFWCSCRGKGGVQVNGRLRYRLTEDLRWRSDLLWLRKKLGLLKRLPPGCAVRGKDGVRRSICLYSERRRQNRQSGAEIQVELCCYRGISLPGKGRKIFLGENSLKVHFLLQLRQHLERFAMAEDEAATLTLQISVQRPEPGQHKINAAGTCPLRFEQRRVQDK
ncbi:hypothetical protein SDC9_151250 [bioreactor metagenome]|uniref:Uncharacterized protein n=1 Tax=bioreactor metagenome TaxID=1076179 RepID=A0A645EU42_9ZZZZ